MFSYFRMTKKTPWIVSTIVTITGNDDLSSYNIIISIDKIIFILITFVSVIFFCLLSYYIFKQNRHKQQQGHYFKIKTNDIKWIH